MRTAGATVLQIGSNIWASGSSVVKKATDRYGHYSMKNTARQQKLCIQIQVVSEMNIHKDVHISETNFIRTCNNMSRKIRQWVPQVSGKNLLLQLPLLNGNYYNGNNFTYWYRLLFSKCKVSKYWYLCTMLASRSLCFRR
jgi:hypothetical protein